MANQDIADTLANAVADAGFLRWALTLTALAALFVGAGGGAGISFLLSKAFTAWEIWMQALPGAGWALLIGVRPLGGHGRRARAPLLPACVVATARLAPRLRAGGL